MRMKLIPINDNTENQLQQAAKVIFSGIFSITLSSLFHIGRDTYLQIWQNRIQ